VVCATAATGYVLRPEHFQQTQHFQRSPDFQRSQHVTAPVVVVDLAVPRDVDPDVAALPGVSLVDLELLAEALRADKIDATDEAAVAEIVAAEVAAYRTLLRGADVAPTVAALRARADGRGHRRAATGCASAAPS